MLMQYYFLDGNGDVQPTDDLMEMAAMFENTERHLGDLFLTTPAGYQWRVSTVFLPFDHGFHFDDKPHKPVLWETMVFRGVQRPGLMTGDMYQARYDSADAALAGHVAAVKWLVNKLPKKWHSRGPCKWATYERLVSSMVKELVTLKAQAVGANYGLVPRERWGKPIKKDDA